jgi:cathepsin B
METGFTVYSDFMNYKTGIYHHTTGTVEGGHAVKMLGWGHDDASGWDYWICANSWGTTWGESGYFKIKQGDCGIDKAVYACTPNTSSSEMEFLF